MGWPSGSRDVDSEAFSGVASWLPARRAFRVDLVEVSAVIRLMGMRIVTLCFLVPIWTPLVHADPQPQPGILAPGKDWELLGQGYQLTADTAVDGDGLVYFTDARNTRILKIDLQGKITVWKEDSGGAHGIAYGPDGRLYAGQHDRKRIVALTPDGKESIVAEGVNASSHGHGTQRRLFCRRAKS